MVGLGFGVFGLVCVVVGGLWVVWLFGLLFGCVVWCWCWLCSICLCILGHLFLDMCLVVL